MTVPVPQLRAEPRRRVQGLLLPPPVMPSHRTTVEDEIAEINRLNEEVFEEKQRELRELRAQRAALEERIKSRDEADQTASETCGLAFDDDGEQVSLCE